jgi:hypothetical protein
VSESGSSNLQHPFHPFFAYFFNTDSGCSPSLSSRRALMARHGKTKQSKWRILFNEIYDDEYKFWISFFLLFIFLSDAAVVFAYLLFLATFASC